MLTRGEKATISATRPDRTATMETRVRGYDGDSRVSRSLAGVTETMGWLLPTLDLHRDDVHAVELLVTKRGSVMAK